MPNETQPKRILIVWYSRTGTTRTVGEQLAEALGDGVEVEELADTKKRGGPLGFIGAGRDALRRTLVPIEPVRCDPTKFELVVVGTPIWAGRMASAVRTYLTDHHGGVGRAAFFYTAASVQYEKVFAEMASLCGIEQPVATLELGTGEVRKDRHTEKLAAFAEAIRRMPA